jgi:hypothetical protein
MPSQSERELQIETRIVALEYLLKQCFWQIILARATQETASDDDDADDLAVRETRLFRKMVVSEMQKESQCRVIIRRPRAIDPL